MVVEAQIGESWRPSAKDLEMERLRGLTEEEIDREVFADGRIYRTCNREECIEVWQAECWSPTLGIWIEAFFFDKNKAVKWLKRERNILRDELRELSDAVSEKQSSGSELAV